MQLRQHTVDQGKGMISVAYTCHHFDLDAGIEWDGLEPAWQDTWHCIKIVWASKWNSRAVSSLSKAGLRYAHLQVAVLCQPVIPAKYAFVAHTTHPVTGTFEQCSHLGSPVLARRHLLTSLQLASSVSNSRCDAPGHGLADL